MKNKNVWSTDWSDKPFEELKKITEHVRVEDNYSYRCSTHIDVLNDVINIANIKSVIEFGGGYWSTSLLLNKCESVITIEQGQNVPKEMNDSWAEKLKDLYYDNPKWIFIKSPGYYNWKSLKFDNCDMVFIDGFPDARAEILQYFIDKDYPIIVAHDTEHDGFHWSKVDNREYRRIDYDGYAENKTTLWTKNDRLIGDIVKLPNYAVIDMEMVRVFEKSKKKIMSF